MNNSSAGIAAVLMLEIAHRLVKTVIFNIHADLNMFAGQRYNCAEFGNTICS